MIGKSPVYGRMQVGKIEGINHAEDNGSIMRSIREKKKNWMRVINDNRREREESSTQQSIRSKLEEPITVKGAPCRSK